MIRGTAGDDIIGIGMTTAADDIVYGRRGADWIDGLGGNDWLYGDEGDDTLIGGEGDDRLYGGLGTDAMFGGAGDDTYFVDDTTDQVDETTGSGVDTVFTRVDFTLEAGQAIEVLWALGSTGLMLSGNELDNLLRGTYWNDVLDGGAGNDVIRALAGNDTITTSGASAVIYAGSGDDTIRIDGASTSSGYVEGGSGHDTVRSADLGLFVFRGVETLDTYYGFLGGTIRQLASFDSYTADLAAPDAQISFSVRGAGGALDFTAGISGLNSVEIRDAGLTSAIYITGSVNSDSLVGSGFHDRLNGGNGDDSLFGGDGRDTLVGEAGQDRLNGGSGSDTMTGGTGDDVFIFDSPIGAGASIDRITDFAPDSDIIEINQENYFPGLTVGQLGASQFAIGTATGSAAQIVYNTSTGALFFDSNGADAGGALQFAILTGAPALAASDFLIV
ncbi:calcium-binding protein [Reyranella sp.]|uniref:calcium-binding protein n=1 Tax=Reyranella sp. TaxID=1929291 RepID=UPI00271F381E|nr:calcium-binding protein [Reyranella sp.]MDO8972433.1 calcium-binding protein [Reyranella sp.]MDP3240497.1 calcium-binding protein [Reyranella sp.]